MTISSLTSSSAASQLSYVSKLGSASAGAESGQVGNGPPPPRSGGGFIDAIASVLESLGLSEGDSATADSSSPDASSTGSGNAAQALGSFLHELMGALHEQGASSSESSSSSGDGQAYGPPGGAGGPGGPGGPGKLEADLQSLIAKLGSSSESAGSEGTEDSAEDSGSALQSSFQGLLEALGSDTSNSGSKLASFLQALSDKLPNAGTSGNLINTSV
jgi:hypothetical protein